LLEVVNADEIN